MALVKMIRKGRVAEQDESNVQACLRAGWELVEKKLPEPVKEEVTKPKADIPEGWETAHHFTKIKIARGIDPEFKGSSQDAEALIRKTLEARQSLS